MEVKPEHGDRAPLECDPVEDAESDSSSSASSGSDGNQSTSGDSDVPVEPPTKVRRFRPKLQQAEHWFVHGRSHILHLLDAESPGRCGRQILMCGKQLTQAYSRCSEASAWNASCKLVHS